MEGVNKQVGNDAFLSWVALRIGVGMMTAGEARGYDQFFTFNTGLGPWR